ncbi:MAG: DUF2752 domain-containing protein [Nanoarchaeota archaeon]|nr:DUF2752 domain-containing protein [Nanoarchaeota archaeon]MBU1854530.1 DUF2752 domain-containing protein [Nanoarchaeota archaeon]
MGRQIKKKLKALKNIFFDIISFGSPQARVFNLTSILLILRVIPTSGLSYSPFKCIFKHFLLPLIYRGNCPTTGLFANCECPACGLTRAMSRLIHGDLTGALAFNKLVILVFIVMITLIIINAIKIIKE